MTRLPRLRPEPLSTPRGVLRGPRRAALLAALLAALPLLSGCDILLFLIVSPFFPGVEQEPLPPQVCPLSTPPAVDPGPLPDAFVVGAEPAPACDVGAKPLHRLNRDELTRSLRDLTGVPDLEVESAFPADDHHFGFDNNAAILGMSPLFVEKAEQVARAAVDAALFRPGERSEKQLLEAEATHSTTGLREETLMNLGGGSVERLATIPADGTYVVRIRAAQVAAGTVPARAALTVNGQEVARFDVNADRDSFELLETTVELGDGEGPRQPVQRLGVTFVNPGESDGTERRLLVDFIELEGPTNVTRFGADPEARARVLGCDLQSAACIDDVIARFARRAWRGTPEPESLQTLRALYDDGLAAGDDAEQALRTTLAAVIVSPRFLFRVEIDADPASTAPHRLSDHELATRLSYFFWSSGPDDRLLDIADRGVLHDPDVLEAEARRMLNDPRSVALVKNFAGQWLFSRGMAGVTPDPARFPFFDEEVRFAMQCETELLFDHYLRDPDLAALDMIDDDTTFVNERLATHYGLSGPKAQGLDTLEGGWGKVSLAGTGRAGLLTHGSLLTINAYPTRTSPTKRGKWIADNLLCLPPDPPPPGVEGVVEEPEGERTGSLRDNLERHRSDPECMGCHSAIDPLGFPLEHFDATGRFRGSDNGFAIDDSALLYDAIPVDGPSGVGAYLKGTNELPRCMTQKAMTYGLGRGVTDPDDTCSLDALAASFADSGYSFQELFVAIVKDPSFRFRRGDGAVDDGVDGEEVQP